MICSQNIDTCNKKDGKYFYHGYIKYESSCVISNCSFLIDERAPKFIQMIKIICDDIVYNIQFDTIENIFWKIGEFRFFSLNVPQFILSTFDGFVKIFEVIFVMTKKFMPQFFYVKYETNKISKKIISYDLIVDYITYNNDHAIQIDNLDRANNSCLPCIIL